MSRSPFFHPALAGPPGSLKGRRESPDPDAHGGGSDGYTWRAGHGAGLQPPGLGPAGSREAQKQEAACEGPEESSLEGRRRRASAPGSPRPPAAPQPCGHPQPSRLGRRALPLPASETQQARGWACPHLPRRAPASAGPPGSAQGRDRAPRAPRAAGGRAPSLGGRSRAASPRAQP